MVLKCKMKKKKKMMIIMKVAKSNMRVRSFGDDVIVIRTVRFVYEC